MALRSLLLLAMSALALHGCATSATAPAWTAADVSTSRACVAPLNLSVRIHSDLSGTGRPVWDELRRQLRERHEQVWALSALEAERAWLQASSELDLADRSMALQEGWSRFARHLGAERDCDLTVLPSLVARPARLHGYHASWDGVTRPLSGAMPFSNVGVDVDFRVQGVRGEIAAASLHVAVLRPDGSLVHEGLGGLDVIQELPREADAAGTRAFLLRSEPFRNPEHIRRGVARALERPVAEVARR